MAYLSREDFKQLCLDTGFNMRKMQDHLMGLGFSKANCTPKRLTKRINTLRTLGYLPLDSGNYVSGGEILKGTSTLYAEDGSVKQQWVKTDVEKQSILEAFANSIESMSGKIEPIEPSSFNGTFDSDILVKIPIADAHIGLLTWHKEVGVDFDLDIAKGIYTEAMSRLVEASPHADTCLLLDLGDTIHTDDQSNQTKASKHQLDVDGRFDKLFDMTLHILCSMIDIALTKYPEVVFRKTRGNHDPDASIAIAAALEMRYSNEPRVTVERSPSIFWWYKFGKTLHFSTHGHTVRKQTALPEIAAYDCKSVWSDCDFVYIDTGHVHHQQILETRTAICESHNSLTAGDSYNYGH